MDEIPFGNQFEQAVNNFTRTQGGKLKGKAIQTFKEMLASGTEPFFRIGMGERHFGPKEFSAGVGLWLLTIIASLPAFMILPKWYATMGAISSFGVLIRFIQLSNQNAQELQKIRAEKKAHHTRSPGRLRWEDPVENTMVRIAAPAILLVTAPTTGIAYIASMVTSQNLAKEQAQKIYNNYLDSRDNQIEAMFMERALKGEVPAECTYLYAPISTEYDEETREDIARAWVAGTPKSMAQPPKPTITTKQVNGGPTPSVAKTELKPDPPSPQTTCETSSNPADEGEGGDGESLAGTPEDPLKQTHASAPAISTPGDEPNSKSKIPVLKSPSHVPTIVLEPAPLEVTRAKREGTILPSDKITIFEGMLEREVLLNDKGYVKRAKLVDLLDPTKVFPRTLDKPSLKIWVIRNGAHEDLLCRNVIKHVRKFGYTIMKQTDEEKLMMGHRNLLM